MCYKEVQCDSKSIIVVVIAGYVVFFIPSQAEIGILDSVLQLKVSIH